MTKRKKQTIKSLEKRLEKYERIENTLRSFFSSTNYCYNHCFSKDNAVIGWNSFGEDKIAPGEEGCCYNKYKKLYLFGQGVDSLTKQAKIFEGEFQKKQIENIKPNFEQQGSCDYHTKEGCAIEKFRSPLCNSWICPDYKIYLSKEFNINYSGVFYSDNIVKSLLSCVYSKKINLNLINKTISNLKKATTRIEKHEKGQEYKEVIQV